MSVYMTEDEQVEAIKTWFQKHGSKVTILLSLVLIMFAAGRYWVWHTTKINTQASVVFEQMMLADANHELQNAQAFATRLRKEYPKTVYSDAANLELAKQMVIQKDYDNAIDYLNRVRKKSRLIALKQVASIRLARIYTEKMEFEKAFELLNPLEDSFYKSVVNELEGDIYARRGQVEQSRNHYKIAAQQNQEKGIRNPYLDMKVSDSIVN